MSTKDTKDTKDTEETSTGEQETDASDEQVGGSHKPESADVELSEEGREEVHQMAEAYEDKPTAVLPGTHGTITGTAVNRWLDDEGNPKFGDPDEHPYAEGEDTDDGNGDGSDEASEGDSKDASGDSARTHEERPKETAEEN